MLRRIMFSLLLATSITSVYASDTEDKKINGFRFHRTPETGTMIYDQTDKNIGSIFPENTLELLEPYPIEDTLIPVIPSLLKEFPKIQKVNISRVPSLNPSNDVMASYRLLRALLSHDIATINIFRLQLLKEDNINLLPENNSLQALSISYCQGEKKVTDSSQDELNLMTSQFIHLVSKLESLRRLILPQAVSDNITSSNLTYLNQIENLTIITGTSAIKSQDIAQLPSLTRLVMGFTSSHPANIMRLGEGLKKRTTPLFLELMGGFFNDKEFKHFFKNQQYSQITGLSLNKTSVSDPQSLRYLDSAFTDGSLQTLDLGIRVFDKGGLDILLTSSCFSNITALNLSNTILLNADVYTLMSSVASNTTLKILKMSPFVTDIQPLPERGNTTLTALSTPGVKLTIPDFDKLSKLPNLTDLDFGYSAQPGENPLETFKSVRTTLTALERVHINGVGQKAEKTLVDILKDQSNHPFDKYF
ncbi:MAG: hypothetical protein J0H12_07565 [Candidatus Paracaedimonas acanthamoebae]|uniref:Uncharacterized protein n=1 Tax=Candidatus Paracaedimonas acanthamoebae TaxID=244581 RepID=A0A8J7TUA4_9PROT|nr:hypothetical protein [Candidatus Paracaedimonas acanthamoebae]